MMFITESSRKICVDWFSIGLTTIVLAVILCLMTVVLRLAWELWPQVDGQVVFVLVVMASVAGTLAWSLWNSCATIRKIR